MEKENFNHGFDNACWEHAKGEARKIMYQVAKNRGTIAYSELVARIHSIDLQAHDPRLDHFLGEIASEDDSSGLGLTTVVVVHKTDEQQPGSGFFELAESRGREFQDQTAFWIEELNRVHDQWSAH